MKIALLHRHILNTLMILTLSGLIGQNLRAIDIAPMNWTPRSGWINVKSPGAYTTYTPPPGKSAGAMGDGTTDDAAAINGVLDWVTHHSGTSAMGRHPTVYFPAGTYYIGSTLYMNGAAGAQGPCNLIGNGLNTIMQWHGPTGGAMVWADGECYSEYVGFVWDGMNTASCGFLEYSSAGIYMTRIRHENESFRNFTAPTTNYGSVTDPEGSVHNAPVADPTSPNGYLGTAIISGFNTLAQPVGEVTIFNCRFYNCTEGIRNPVDVFNHFMWAIEGCEFDNNGTAVDGSGGGDNMIVLNSHFQGSTVDDLAQNGGLRGQRLTSSGSAQFFSGCTDGTVFQDCWVDDWTNPAGAMAIYYGGVGSLVDCTFTNPPAGAAPPVYLVGNSFPLELMLSNLSAPAFPSGLLNEAIGSGTFFTENIPNGSLGGNITSASQTFLRSTYPPDSPNILNILTYGADDFGVTNDLTSDSTAAIQAAINAAAAANNGSIVYIPAGYYNISSLNITGGNYIIEGDGLESELFWNGGGSGALLAVSNPHNITIRNINVTVWNNSEPAVKETSTGPSSITYDNVIDSNLYGSGLVLDSLPAESTVYIPVLESPLTANDCGPAQIFSLRAYFETVNVSGATQPKTGFLGLMVAEGGQDYGDSGGTNNGLYNFTITDNQNLLVGPYYSEEEGNDVSLSRGAGTTTGHVAIEGLQTMSSLYSTTINVNNYAGRFFYGDSHFMNNWGNNPVQVVQTGTNPIDLILAGDLFNYDSSTPTFQVETGANVIATFNEYGGVRQYAAPVVDTPNPLTAANLNSLASALDDFRQLGALNLAVEYGIVNPSGLVAYWKLDETASPSIDSSMSGMTGTWENGPAASLATPTSIPYADSGSMSFNGVNQYVSMSNIGSLPSGTHARTICGWGKSNSLAGGYRWIAAYGSPNTDQAMFIGMNGTSLVGGGYGGDDIVVPNFWDNNWHFIVLTYDGTTGKLYADGNLMASSTKAWNLVPGACYIGEQINNAGEFWNGQIDDVRIYNYALSAAEVASLYAPTGHLLPIAATGYTQDVIYGPASGDTTATALFQGYHLYDAGQGSNGGTGGLPDSGVINSPSNPNVTFQLQPYNASNVLPLQGTSGTLTLTTPASYTSISVLLTNAGYSGASFTLNFSDGSHTVVNYPTLPYWVDDDPGPSGGSIAFQGSALVNDGTWINLDEYDYTLTAGDAAKTLNSITFTEINYTDGTMGVFALSGCPK